MLKTPQEGILQALHGMLMKGLCCFIRSFDHSSNVCSISALCYHAVLMRCPFMPPSLELQSCMHCSCRQCCVGLVGGFPAELQRLIAIDGCFAVAVALAVS